MGKTSPSSTEGMGLIPGWGAKLGLLLLNCLPWKQTGIILSFLKFHPSTAFWTLLLTI